MKPAAAGVSLGDVLVEEGLITAEQHHQAHRAARRLGAPVVAILLEQGLVAEEALFDAVRHRLDLPVFDPRLAPVDPDAVRVVPFGEATRYRLLPIQFHTTAQRRVLRVAMVDPLDAQAIEDLEFSTGETVEPHICRHSLLEEAIRQHYRGVVTKVIQRQPQGRPTRSGEGGRRRFGGALSAEQIGTAPVALGEADEPLDPAVEALVNLLEARGLLSREEFLQELRRLRD